MPDTLNKTLSQWLADSIGDGTVEQGAFLWRGSLKKGVTSLRTVQLAFNISETFVDYHPRWPAVEVVQGIILMDDSEVSVWADEAVLYDSVIRRLSVETWLGDDRALMAKIAIAIDCRCSRVASMWGKYSIAEEVVLDSRNFVTRSVSEGR